MLRFYCEARLKKSILSHFPINGQLKIKNFKKNGKHLPTSNC